MTKKILAVIIASFMVLTGCHLTSANKEYDIVLITKSNLSAFWKTCISGAKSAEVEYGNVKLTTKYPNSESDYDKQNEYIQQAIDEQVDAIIFSACNYSESTEYIERAVECGIPVIIIDSNISTDKELTFIGTDNKNAGRKAAEAVVEALGGSGSVGVISFEENSANGDERVQGFMEFIDEVEGVQVLEVKYSFSDYDIAQQTAQEMIDKYSGTLDAIATFNELTTIGVARAVDSLEDPGSIYVLGFDNNTESIQQLENGSLNALIVQNPFAMGYMGVQKALDEISGVTEKQNVDTGVVVVTSENMYDPETEKLLFPFSDS